MNRLGRAFIGAVLAALLVLALPFVASFFVNVAALGIPAIVQWLLVIIAAASGFVVGLFV